MGTDDMMVQQLLWRWLVPGFAFMVGIYLLKGQMYKAYLVGYAKVLSRLEKGMSKLLRKHKQELFSSMEDMMQESKMKTLSVLEIGAGTGTNFQFYPEGTNIMCLDPNPSFASYLDEKRDTFNKVLIQDLIVGKAEDLSAFPDQSVDVVVCTLVLCSVDDIHQCMTEIKRVLKKGGKFYFLEHVCADKSRRLYTVQRWLNPVWIRFADGCSLVKETWKDIEKVSFNDVTYEILDIPMKRTPIDRFVKGIATK